jgi:hypothetical protein
MCGCWCTEFNLRQFLSVEPVLGVLQQHSGAAMQRTRHLKVGALTDAQARGVGHHTAAVRQASNNGTTEAPQATAQEAAGNSFTQDHFIFPSPLTASARVCVLPCVCADEVNTTGRMLAVCGCWCSGR